MTLRESVLAKMFGAVKTDRSYVFPYRSTKFHPVYEKGEKVILSEMELSVAVTFVTETGRESKPFVNFTYTKSVTLRDDMLGDYGCMANILHKDEALITKLMTDIVNRRKSTGDLKSYVDHYMKTSKRKIHSVYISDGCGASKVMKIDESVFRKEFLGE